MVLRFKQKVFSFFFQNITQTLFFSLFVILGLALFIIQLAFTEEDYSNRIGTYMINFDEKIILLKLFFIKIFQIEIIFLILTSLFLRFDNKFLKFNEIKNSKYDILLIFFFASLLSPFIFLILTNKVIALYQFWTTVKFFGFLYIFICVCQFFVTYIIKKQIQGNPGLVTYLSLRFRASFLLSQTTILFISHLKGVCNACERADVDQNRQTNFKSCNQLSI